MQEALNNELSSNELNALIKLLDDDDQGIYEHVSEKLRSFGEVIIPNLEAAWEKCFDVILQERLEEVIHQIQFKSVKEQLRQWSQNGNMDLIRGFILIAKYQYPDLDTQQLLNKIETIKRDAWLELHYNLSPLEKIKILNHVFYNIHGFRGNTKNYHDPQNSFINIVLESKKGNQISLAAIYLAVAQRLDIPIYGVNLPQHFILAYANEHQDESGEKEKILFYINAFNKGYVFSRKDIDYFLGQLKLEKHPAYYQPCDNVEILRRMVRNLINSYGRLGSEEKVAELKELLNVIKHGPNKADD